MTSLRRNVLWSISGAALPVAVALAAVPVMSRHLAPDFFGWVSLALIFLGTFSIIDLGMGRNLLLIVSRTHPLDPEAPGDQQEVWIGIALVMVPGVLAATALLCLRAGVVAAVGIRPAAVSDAELSVALVAAMLPLVSLHAVLRAFCEGQQDFPRANFNKILTGVATLGAASLAAIQRDSPLWMHVAPIALARLACIAQLAVSVHRAGLLSGLRRPAGMFSVRHRAFRDAAWVSVATLLGPVTTYADKMLVASLVTAALLPAYSIPSDVFTKLLIVPGAFSAVLLARLASNANGRAVASERRLEALLVAYCVLGSACAAWLAAPVLRLMMGPLYDPVALDVARVLLMGICFNGLAHASFARLQASGRSDSIAKLHLVELALYLGALVLLCRAYGVVGAAWAWTMRATLDWAALEILNRRLMR